MLGASSRVTTSMTMTDTSPAPTPPAAASGTAPATATDLGRLNHELREASAREVLRRTFERGERVIVSSSFGPDSAVLLRLVSDVRPDATVVWVDTGHHTRATHRFVERVIDTWRFDLRVYHPRRRFQRSEAGLDDVPGPDDPDHADFVEAIKLEPFRRALGELKPDHWITGIRAEETDWRRTLDVASSGPDDIVKVAPLLHWTRADIDRFLHEHRLPGGHDYHDVAKAGPKRECGLHDRL